MNAEAKNGRHEVHNDSQVGLYAKDKIEEALGKNPEYSSKLTEQLEKLKSEAGYMSYPIEVKIADATYQVIKTKRLTKVLGRVVREHEMMIVTRATSDEETKVQINTTKGESESIGKVFLYRNNERFVGEEALDIMDSSFPEIFLNRLDIRV